MKTHSPAEPKRSAPLSILLIGPPGTGKTTLALQFPGVAIMDCDNNLDGPVRYLRLTKREPTFNYSSMRLEDDGKTPVPVENAYDRLIDEINACKNNPNISTIVVDSLTHVNEFVCRKVLAAQGAGRLASGVMEGRDWNPFKAKTYGLLVGALQGTGKTTICTCHEKILTESDQKDFMKEKVIGYRPAYQGGVTDYFGAFFTDMWRCEVRTVPGDRKERWIVTLPTPKSDLKNSLNMPGEINVTAGYSAIEKYVKQAM